MNRRVNRVYLALIALLALTVGRVGLPNVRAQGSNRAGLVVHFGDGPLVTRCIEFSQPELSGYDFLARSRLKIVAAFDSPNGAAICAIEGEGCPVESCLTCAAPNYWSYWHLAGGSWVYSAVGASGHKVHNGDVEGWSWGAGEPPDVVPFDQICPPPSPTPMPPTATPVPPSPTSMPPTAPPAATNTPEPVVWFRLDQNPIPVGSCTMVRWDTTYVQEVYLDGERVDANGSIEVCPTASREYHLRVMTAAGERTHTLVLGVSGTPLAPTSTPEPVAPVAPSPTPSPQPTATAPLEPSPTPSPQPTSTASSAPSSTPIPQPMATASSEPSPTPQPVAGVSPLPSPTPVPEPTSIPAPSLGPAQPTVTIPKIVVTQPAVEDQPVFISPVSCVGFAVIVFGLLGLLIYGVLRRR